MYTHLLLVACRLHTNSNIVGVSDLNNFRSYRSKYMTNIVEKSPYFVLNNFVENRPKNVMVFLFIKSKVPLFSVPLYNLSM